MQSFYYLFIDLLTILFPIVWSFERKMYFYSKWRYVFKSIFITGAIFILWDFIFTYLGVWGFNSKYVLGLYLINLPIEEVLFFTVVPFSCLFIYESVYFLLNNKIKKGVFYQISLVASLFLFFAGVMNYDKLYTCLACVGASLILVYHVARKKQMNHEVFWISYLVVLVPFTIVNGILTGSFTEEPIVWYNNAENMGVRFLTIPIEDFAYNLFLLLLNVTLYERFLGRLYSK
ncbi:MAG: lycopene cyclase domain-containing protein [Cytophagales bacterium]